MRETIPGPVYVYVYYKNFYLNHRNVMKSFDKDQLRGTDKSVEDLVKSCGDVRRNKDIGVSKFWNNTNTVDPEAALNPCGILPSLFPSGRPSS